MRLADLGEVKAIEIIKNIAKKHSKYIEIGIGDDAAVLKDKTIVTTDAYIEDIHFSLDYFTLFEIGQRVACGTLSDIGAMVGRPIAIFISALLPSTMKRSELTELYKGIISVADRFDCEIAGGDIVAYPKLGLILTALGKAKKYSLRCRAKPNDYVYITGYCGLAETGRLALKNKLPKIDFPNAIKRHTCPLPRINEALKLKRYINALIDTSDGLSTDAFHIAEESKVKIKIFADSIPIHIETKKLSHIQYSTYNISSPIVLDGGEDYELLFTSKNKNLPKQILGTKITQIGIVEKGRGVFLIKDNKEIPMAPKGFDHFRP